MYELNDCYLEDARVNLNVRLNQPILVIADLGLWDGRHMGYQEIQSGNIRDCLYGDTDYTTWYVDRLATCGVTPSTTTAPTTIYTVFIKMVRGFPSGSG